MAIRVQVGRGNQMETDCPFKIGGDTDEILLLQAEHRCDGQIDNRLIVTDSAAAMQGTCCRFPEAGNEPVTLGEPLPIKIPDGTNPCRVRMIAVADFHRNTVYRHNIATE